MVTLKQADVNPDGRVKSQKQLKKRKRDASLGLALVEYMAGELGLEPRLTESESAVLPLDDSPN